jgi:HK97 gp10 family phage protein
MAIRVRLETKGFKDYLERVAATGQNVDTAADAALEAGGAVLLAGMKRRVPKDTHNLEEHLVVEGPNVDGNQHYIEVGLARDSDKETARYANAQEYGTSSMSAQPYIRPTMDSDLGKARAAMRAAFEDGMK